MTILIILSGQLYLIEAPPQCYPRRNIPVFNSPGLTAQSVEGVWQGLKVFETEDIGTSKFVVAIMRVWSRVI